MDHILTLFIFSPAIAAILIVLNIFKGKTAYLIGVVSSLFSLFMASYIAFGTSEQAGLSFFQTSPWWLENINYTVGVDGLSAALLLLTSIIFPLCILSVHNVKNMPKMIAMLLFLETMIFGVFCAQDLVLFYLFFEASLIPMYFMIGIWGGAGRIFAGFKFFLYTLAGSLLMLIAIIYIYNITGSTSFSDILAFNFTLPQQKWLWMACFFAFAVKVPMFPFHTWLPVAHVEAPTAGSVILASILLKMGGYGFLRISIPMFPDASIYFANFVFILSAIAIIYASLVAFSQKDIKRLIAYSSVAHMGYVTMAMFSLNEGGIQASIYQMISHGFVSAGLFFVIGVVYERYHTRQMNFYGGLAKVMPSFALVFMVFTMANVGLPGTSGFIGELLTIINIAKVNMTYAVIITLGVIASASYGLWLYRSMMFGETKDKFIGAVDLSLREKIIFAPLIILTVYFGFYTNPITDFVSSSVQNILQSFAQ